MHDADNEVTQADREAVAEFIEDYWCGNHAMGVMARSYRAGQKQGAFTRHFARHRIASIEAACREKDAEIARLSQELDEETALRVGALSRMKHAEDERDQLRAKLDEARGLLQDCREAYLRGDSMPIIRRLVSNKIRAFLASAPQPEQKVQGEGGEPVAYMVNGRAFSAEAMRGKTISEGDAVTPLYAHPPAPASVAGEPEQITAPRCTICGTCAPEGFAKDCNRPPFNFDRYINGVLMAEGVWVEKAGTLDAAMVIASRIASRGSDGEVPVLVYRPCAPAPVEAGALDQMVRRSVMASAELGKWLSSALDEPSVCDEMKADIREWFSAGEPELVQYARAALSQPASEEG